MALAQEADRLIDQAREPDVLALLALGEKLWRIRDGLEQFGDFLAAGACRTASAPGAQGGAPGLDRWVALLAGSTQSFGRAAGLQPGAAPDRAVARRAICRAMARARALCDAGR